jgi:hypothetical protein
MSDFINVHTFDGKLNGIFLSSAVYTIEDKKIAFSNLIKLLTNSNAKKATQIMINDLSNKEGSNFHQANNLDASDILMEICKWLENPDVVKLLNEQLVDAKKLGMCNSGRVTRLLQIWSAFL